MITNFQINKIESRKYPDTTFSSVSINHELNMKNPNIVTQKTPFGDKDILRIEFQLNVNYLNPNLGYMIFEGTSEYFSDENLTLIKDEWSNPNNDGVNKIKNEFSGMIFSNVIPFAMMVSSRMNLPSVVPIPQINFTKKVEKKEERQNYIG